MTFGSLFSGIGGFDYGLECAGMSCKWQVERDEFCRRVLTKHWPGIPKWNDVRGFEPKPEHYVDCIAGGFPCQDISNAGGKAGIDGERSGLWSEFYRIVGAIRPRFIIVENVAALLVRGLGRVVGDLSKIGYDAQWSVISASRIGFAHERERVFVIAYPAGIGRNAGINYSETWTAYPGQEGIPSPNSCKDGWDVQRWIGQAYTTFGFPPSDTATLRAINGIPNRVDRIKAIGNAVVPYIAEQIGRRIIAQGV